MRAGSVKGALSVLPEANLAVISVPGAFAAREARLALERGQHVMLFSDNVTLDDEVALKKLAVSKGLLLMGPDCGTAIVNGKPLCFANEVRRGGVGIVAAAGTGLQEVSVLIDRYGAGISQAIGTGGRDLKNPAVGGMTALLAIEALAADSMTTVITVVSKPPVPEVAEKVAARLKASGKPAVAFFLGLERKADDGKLLYAANLEEAARLSALLALGTAPGPARKQVEELMSRDSVEAALFPGKNAATTDLRAAAAEEAKLLSTGQKYLRGLFTGGTLCDEALFLAHEALGRVYSNNHTNKEYVLQDPKKSREHTIVDLGDDVFTVGKPHPMIEPSLRNERLVKEAEDPETAVMLFDVVLGYGSHADPAGELADAVAKARAAAKGRHIAAVASVTGTEADPQSLGAQARKLQDAGIFVLPSNYRAAMFAVDIMRELAKRGEK